MNHKPRKNKIPHVVNTDMEPGTWWYNTDMIIYQNANGTNCVQMCYNFEDIVLVQYIIRHGTTSFKLMLYIFAHQFNTESSNKILSWSQILAETKLTKVSKQIYVICACMYFLHLLLLLFCKHFHVIYFYKLYV